jgi:hypothetical protein
MNFGINDNEEQIKKFMEDAAGQSAQLQRGYDKMAFIAGAILGFLGAVQGSGNVFSYIVLPLLTGGFFVFVRKATSR